MSRNRTLLFVAVALAIAGCDLPDFAQPTNASEKIVDRSVSAARAASPVPQSRARFGIAPEALVAPITLTIPQSHPRIWYSAAAGTPGAARLTRARAYMPSDPIPQDHWQLSTKMLNGALWSMMTGNPGNANFGCTAAANWVRTYNFPSADEARWSGESAILIYDWCHAQLSAADRADIINQWNTRLKQLNGEWWGGPTMPANNYFWGYLRNSLLWGMASYHDNPQAQSFIDEALTKRYTNKFFPWYQAFGVGGVPLEGGQYGPYMFGYPLVAFSSVKDYGFDAWNAVDFWRDATYYLHYATTPSATRARDGATPLYEMFPFNDDQFFELGGTANNGEYGDVLSAMILRNPSSPVAAVARDWMLRTNTKPSWWSRAELATVSIPASAPALPLDYYASGAKYFYGRREHDAGATAFMLQMGNIASGSDTTGGVGHTNLDAGSFQLWRKGRWMSRETTAYGGTPSYYIRGLNNAPNTDAREAIAQNTVLFEGRGQIDEFRGFAKVTRLQSTPQFAYTAVDLTDAYRATVNEGWQAGDDWPFAEKAIREFVYLRKLDTLVVLDRVKSGSDSLDPIYDSCCQWQSTTPFYTGPQLSANQVRKSFLLHAGGTGSNADGNPFTLGGAGQATATVGDQRMDLITLLPANPTYRVIDEGGSVGQFRIEYDVSGAAQSFLLNVISLRDASETRVSASLEDLDNAWSVHLSHPGKGTATLTFQKGESSSGGSVRVDQGAAIALRENRQGMTINDNGVFWEGQPGGRMVNVGSRYPVFVPDTANGPANRRPGLPLVPAQPTISPRALPRSPKLPKHAD